jgi:PAS domain S-box-containing protein
MSTASRPNRVVVIGASAGGVEALKEVAAGLPADLPAAVLVALHVPSSETSLLPAILQRAGPLPALHANDGDRLVPGVILVAQTELERARRELETAYEELQSTVEELETTNEELQSTNEELETMNEKLQSTNEELETMNDELRDRTDEALRANSFLGSILAGIHQSVVVVDGQLRVTAWSRAAAELWGLRAEEVQGEHFLNLDIGIPVGQLRDPMRRILAGEDAPDVELTGHNRRGQPIRVVVSFAQLQAHNGEADGVIVAITAERAEKG